MTQPSVGLVHKGSIPARHKLERCPYNTTCTNGGEGNPDGCRRKVDVGISVPPPKNVKSRSERELLFSSYTTIFVLWTVGTSRECDEEREDKLGHAVPRSVTGITGLTLYSQHTGHNGCDEPCKHTGFRPGLKAFHFHTLLLSTIEQTHWLTWDTCKVYLLV